MANGLVASARHLQQREDDAVKAFGKLLPLLAAPATSPVRPEPRVL
jgi:hypothetical protein